MVLTTEQQEKIVRLRAKATKLNDELENVIISEAVLTPIKEQEIINVNTKITSYINHADMTRAEYVIVVQPLKDKRTALIQENEVIHQENNALKEAAQQQYNDDRVVIQQHIDGNETELLNAIKTVDLSKVMLEK